jgi:hypothetical protein
MPDAQVEGASLAVDDSTEDIAAAEGLNAHFERTAKEAGVGSGTLYRTSRSTGCSSASSRSPTAVYSKKPARRLVADMVRVPRFTSRRER